MTYQKDEVWGTPRRRTLTLPVSDHPIPTRVDDGLGALGPEAYERAQGMAYDRMRRIQVESPYEVVEHVVHDQRLRVGIWSTAGVGAVATFLTFSLPCLLVTGVALFFALYTTPGRQERDVD